MMWAPRSLLQLAGWSVACAIIALNGFSHLLADTNPRAALLVNPFNTDASVNVVVRGLEAGAEADLVALKQDAERALRSSPGDARTYSALGGVIERQGDAASAGTLYQLALARSKTEMHALSNMLSRAAERGDYVTALGYADLSLRRWPTYSGQVMPVVSAAIRDPAGEADLRRRMQASPPWRWGAIRQLLSDGAGIAFVRDLILAEAAAGHPAPPSETGMVIEAMVRAGVPAQAYQFFVLTMAEDEKPVAGYVYDSQFSRAPHARYFGWVYRPNAAADVAFPAPGGGLRLRFLDSPARLGNIFQTLSLPPGSYDLQMIATASGLRIPRGLYWRVRCTSGGPLLARLDVAPDSYERAGRVVGLEVPATGCPLQNLTLDTDLRTESWRDRYSGIVTFEMLRMVRK